MEKWDKTYVSAAYIDEKAYPIKNLLRIVEDTENNNIVDKLSRMQVKEIAFAFAVIAKELDVEIPTNV